MIGTLAIAAIAPLAAAADPFEAIEAGLSGGRLGSYVDAPNATTQARDGAHRAAAALIAAQMR